MATNLTKEITSNFNDVIDVSSMGITNTNELWFMYTTDGYNWITVDPTDIPVGLTITYNPTVVNEDNILQSVTISGLPTNIVKLILYRKTDISQLPNFTPGKINTSALMNKMRNIIYKALEETRGHAGTINSILLELLQAKAAAEAARDEIEEYLQNFYEYVTNFTGGIDGGYALPVEEWDDYSWVDPGDANANAPDDDAVTDYVDGDTAATIIFEDTYDGGQASDVYFKRPMFL